MNDSRQGWGSRGKETSMCWRALAAKPRREWRSMLGHSYYLLLLSFRDTNKKRKKGQPRRILKFGRQRSRMLITSQCSNASSYHTKHPRNSFCSQLGVHVRSKWSIGNKGDTLSHFFPLMTSSVSVLKCFSAHITFNSQLSGHIYKKTPFIWSSACVHVLHFSHKDTVNSPLWSSLIHIHAAFHVGDGLFSFPCHSPKWSTSPLTGRCPFYKQVLLRGRRGRYFPA